MFLTIGVRPDSDFTSELNGAGLCECLSGQAEHAAAGVHADSDLVASDFDTRHWVVPKYCQRQGEGVPVGAGGGAEFGGADGRRRGSRVAPTAGKIAAAVSTVSGKSSINLRSPTVRVSGDLTRTRTGTAGTAQIASPRPFDAAPLGAGLSQVASS